MTSDVHFAFGRIHNPPENLICQTVCSDSLCCLVSRHDSIASKGLTLHDYQTREHIVVRPSAKLETGVFSVLNDLGIHRRVRCEVTHFHYLPALLCDSPYLATVPARIAAHLASLYPLSVLPTPQSFAPFPFHLAWHQRYHRDPAHQWLRRQIKSCCHLFNVDKTT